VPRLALVALLAALAAAAAADVYYLQDGDRISGKTLSQAAGQYRVQTPYGRVTIPKGKVEKIVHDDGREEVLKQAEAPLPTPEPPPPAARLHVVFVVTGASFWQAWAPSKDATPDPTLRLAVSIDERGVVTYTDAETDPDIPGAIVNAFSFDAEHVSVAAAVAASALPPETRPGRISLRLELNPELAGERSLRVAYQANEGTATAPAWRDLASGAIHAELKAEATNVVRLHQDRGRMEFSGFGRKKMKNVESFRIEMGME
jgi:hypothetical protein